MRLHEKEQITLEDRFHTFWNRTFAIQTPLWFPNGTANQFEFSIWFWSFHVMMQFCILTRFTCVGFVLTNIVQINMNKFGKRRVLTQFHLVFVAQQVECKIFTMENQTPTAGLQPWPKVDFKMQKSQRILLEWFHDKEKMEWKVVTTYFRVWRKQCKTKINSSPIPLIFR